MKFLIEIAYDDGEPCALGRSFEVDTDDPEWREQLPTPVHLAAAIDEHLAGDEPPTVAGAVLVLERIGYDDLAEHLKGVHEEASDLRTRFDHLATHVDFEAAGVEAGLVPVAEVSRLIRHELDAVEETS
jgi:hypothetical protein